MLLGETQKKISELFTIDFSEDNMQAFLTISEPDAETRKLFTPLKFINILNNFGVKYGVKSDTIDEIYNERKWNEKFLIAEGKPSKEGEPASLELYFESEKSLKPKIRENGHVDYKEVCIVTSIEKGASLLKKIAATKGYPGKDVRGNELPAQMGKEITLAAGKGTYWDENDATLLKADGDGIVIYNVQKNTVEVQQIYVIPGSVDYSTGNINVKSSVDIKGDVKPGFSVTTPYGVMVKGVVENASIACKACLKVGAGISGDNVQLITVGGDIHSGYINTQQIKCCGSIYVSQEIRSSNVECENEIVITKPSGAIIGGHTTAANAISSGFIGNSYGILTEITVGVSPRVRRELLLKENEKNIMEKKINDLIKKITYIAQHSPPSLLESRLVTHKADWEEQCKKFEILKSEVADLEKACYITANAVVRVTKTIYPGTTVRIKQAVYEVKEELSHVKFVLEEEQIVCKNLEE
ncbi:MAG: FapA family protein [Bacteroidetes bacterium]|nr:FapA family protein [Bacteroidota bacterium]